MRWLLRLAFALLLAIAGATQAAAIIDNGVIQLGVDDLGDLNAPGGSESSGGSGTTSVGLRYMPLNHDATAAGCDCEGWGASYDGTVGGGTANTGSTGGTGGIGGIGGIGAPGPGIEPVSFSSDASTADVVASLGVLEVEHHYRPSISDNAYEAEVVLRNTGDEPISEVIYRRVMDWDVEPTAFSEYVTLWAEESDDSLLTYSVTDGFKDTNPLSGPSTSGVEGPPNGPNRYDVGPTDHGALFDFNFGTLDPGAERVFWIYYGATADEVTALDVLDQLSAEVYSLGQPDTDPTVGGPNTFLFAFTGVIDRAPVVDFEWTPVTPYEDTVATFTDLTTVFNTFHDTIEWNFDGTIIGGPYAATQDFTFATPGLKTVTLTVVDGLGRAGTATKTVEVLDALPPVADFSISAGPYGTFTDLSFTDLSTDPDSTITSWAWDFGDGTTSVDQHPTHRYASQQRFDITLTVTDSQGESDTASRSVTVVNFPPKLSIEPVAPVYTFDTVRLTAAVVDPEGEPVSVAWTFSDGTQMTGLVVEHRYTKSGNEYVQVVATDAAGAQAATSVPFEIKDRAPTAAIVVEEQGEATSDVWTFRDASADVDGQIVKRQWDFGDETAATIEARHAFPAAGSYDVRLKVWDDAGLTDEAVYVVHITNEAPIARYEATDRDGKLHLQDQSINPDGGPPSVEWRIGDQTYVGPFVTLDWPSETVMVTMIVTDDEGGRSVRHFWIRAPTEPQAPGIVEPVAVEEPPAEPEPAPAPEVLPEPVPEETPAEVKSEPTVAEEAAPSSPGRWWLWLLALPGAAALIGALAFLQRKGETSWP